MRHGLIIALLLTIVTGVTLHHIAVASNDCFQSARFGWTVTWQPPWQQGATDQVPDGYDLVRIEAEDSYFEYYGVPWTGMDAASGLERFLTEFRADWSAIEHQQEQGGRIPAVYAGIDPEGQPRFEYTFYQQGSSSGLIIVSSYGEALTSSQAQELASLVSLGYELTDCDNSGPTVQENPPIGQPATTEEFIQAIMAEPFPNDLLPSDVTVYWVTPTETSLSVIGQSADAYVELDQSVERWTVAYGFDTDDPTGEQLMADTRTGLVQAGYSVYEERIQGYDVMVGHQPGFAGSLVYVARVHGIVVTAGSFFIGNSGPDWLITEQELLVQMLLAEIAHVENAFE